ncbi:MAG: hypothetical protein K2K08_02295 [Paramuribaculum sp.]|nr:hypothetical protein [Paramuribaculum sp.]
MNTCTDLPPGEAVLAHCIIFENKSFSLSVARHEHDGTLSITPFNHEVHTTVFVNGTVSIIQKKSGGYCFTRLKPCDKAELR